MSDAPKVEPGRLRDRTLGRVSYEAWARARTEKRYVFAKTWEELLPENRAAWEAAGQAAARRYLETQVT